MVKKICLNTYTLVLHNRDCWEQTTFGLSRLVAVDRALIHNGGVEIELILLRLITVVALDNIVLCLIWGSPYFISICIHAIIYQNTFWLFDDLGRWCRLLNMVRLAAGDLLDTAGEGRLDLIPWRLVVGDRWADLLLNLALGRSLRLSRNFRLFLYVVLARHMLQ